MPESSPAVGSASGGAEALVTEPNLFAYFPLIPVITRLLTVANTGAIAGQANQAANQAASLAQQGQALVGHAEQTKSFWTGDTAGASFDALFQVGTAIGSHAGEVGKYAVDGLRLANDVKRLITFVNDGQKMADGVVAALSKIPYVGHALAEAYAIKTYIWTGLCIAQLVNIGTDVAGVMQDLNPKKVEQAYTPPLAAVPGKATA